MRELEPIPDTWSASTELYLAILSRKSRISRNAETDDNRNLRLNP